MVNGDGPIRTCTGCRRRRPQQLLVRVARRGDGSIAIGHGAGRGAYVCSDRRCIERALSSGALRRALRHEGPLPEELRARLFRRGEEGTDGEAQGA
ncbi:MAG TPA: YlxR family protein [Actinomycetota bacterium]|nr:YlxR family protein [Actinomycetota bacterium]